MSFLIALPSRRKRYQKRLFFFIASLCLLLSCTSLALANLTTKPVAIQTSQSFNKALVKEWGIELTSLRMTAAGRMVDFRYRVLNAEKAAPLFKRQTKPYLVHEASGKVLAVPNTAKVGSLRNSNMPKPGKIYWMFFGNSGQVKSGDKVSVVIGNFRADHLIVE